MSETTWTPGPWFVSASDNEAGDDPDNVQASNVHASIVSALAPCGEPRYLARVWADGPRPAADAALLAAAPDLYEALAEVECALWLLAAGGSKDAAEKHARTLAALAKARGETP